VKKMAEDAKKYMMLTMVLTLVSVGLILFSFLGFKSTVEGAMLGNPNNKAVCLWQISGSGKDINHLVTDLDSCSRIFERYSAEGECSEESATLKVLGVKNEEITWSYDFSCSTINGGKRFTIMSGVTN